MSNTLGFDLSGLAFSGLSKTWELQRKFNWQLFLPHTFNGSFGPFLSQHCQDVKIGDYGISDLANMNYGAFQRYYAGQQTIEGTTLTFVSPVDNAVLDYFHGWYEKAIDRYGYYYPKMNYARTIYVALYQRSGLESCRFELRGAFPTGRPSLDLSYADEDMVKFTVNLSVDKVVVSSLIGSIRGAIVGAIGGIAEGILGSNPVGQKVGEVITTGGLSF